MAALTGAGISLATLFWQALSFFPFMVFAGTLMVGIAYGFRRWKLILLFFGVSALFGGMVFAINYIIGGEAGVLNVSISALIIATAVSYIIIFVTFRKSATGATKKEYVHIEIENRGKKAELCALVDSGNTLCDPMTNTPVLIAELSAIKELFDNDTYNLIKNLPPEEAVLKVGGKFRVIPFKTVSGAGLLLAFKPQRVFSSGKEREMLVAPTREIISEGCGYQGIIGLEEE